MNQHADPFEQDLTTHLHAALDRLDGAGPPPVADDTARGRRGLRRRRGLAALGSLAAVAVVGTGVAVALGGGGSTAEVTVAADPTTVPTTSAASPSSPAVPVDRRNAKQWLHDNALVLREHLDPDGSHLSVRPTNVQSGEGLGTKLDWRVPGESGLGMVEIYVAPAGSEGFTVFCDPSSPCRRVAVDGVRARVKQPGDGTTGVLVTREDGVLVELYVDPLFGNNSLTPVSGMDIAVDDLIRAAADPRITAPTRRQLENANEAFGFPDPPSPSGVATEARTSG